MSDHDVKVLNGLIATTIDSALGFQEAAEEAKAERFRPIFSDLAGKRREVVSKLQEEVRRLGGAPEDDGTVKAAAHRRWLQLRNALAGGDAAVIKEVENGETYINSKYAAALRDEGLTSATRAAIEEGLASVRAGLNRARDLKRSLPSRPKSRANRSARPAADWNWKRLGLGIGATVAIAGTALAAARLLSRRGDGYDEEFALRLETDENLRLISSKKVEGTPVIGADGERLGTIDSFMVDKYTGHVAYAIMSFGGVMGFGSSLFPLPWPLLTYDTERDGYLLDITRGELADAPRFEPNDEPEFNPEYRRRIIVFYRPATAAPYPAAA